MTSYQLKTQKAETGSHDNRIAIPDNAKFVEIEYQERHNEAKARLYYLEPVEEDR